MAYQFTTAPTFPNSYVTCTINNMYPIITLNKEKKDWMKKYHHIIWRLETMIDIQLQIQNLAKLANATNIELANIKTTLLQSSDTYKMQIRGDIYSISKELWNIIYKDMEKQAHHIQVLLGA